MSLKDIFGERNLSRHEQLKRIAIIIAGALIAVAIISFLIMQSNPGSTLYSLKTNVIEELTEKSLPTGKGVAAYQVERLKERLEEVKALDRKDTISDTALQQLSDQTNKHYHILNNTVVESIDSAFPKTDVLETLNEFASIASAIEQIAENNPNFKTYGDEAEDIRQEVVRTYRDRVESYVATETMESVLTLIQNMLTEVNDGLGDKELSAETVDDAENYLDRVKPAIDGMNFARAINAIGEAYRFIKTDQYGGEYLLAQATESEENATSTEEETSTSTEDTGTSTATTSVPMI